MDSFLSRLKVKSAESSHFGTYAGEELRFMLSCDDAQDTYLSAVDGSGQPVSPDYRCYSGGTAQLLRSMENLLQEQLYQFSWGRSNIDKISLKSHPYLIYQLMQCGNLVDEQMRPISIGTTAATIQLALRLEGDTIEPSLRVEAGGQVHTAFRFITDSFILADGTLYSLSPIGDNYEQLAGFIEPFGKGMLESYLSIFFSYVDNVQLVCDDYHVAGMADEEIATQPTILIEKVDEDSSLYLRVVESVPGLPVDLLLQFALTRVAQLTLDRQIVVRRVAHTPMGQCVETLRKAIVSAAPGRQSQKEVYQEDNLFILPPKVASPFLQTGLLSLLRHFQLIGADKLRKYNIRLVRPKLKLSLSSGIDFLEGDAGVEVDGESFSLQQFLSQYQKQRYVVLSDGSHALLDEGYMRKLERLFRAKRGQKGVKVSFFDLPEVETLLDEQLKGDAFKHHRQVYEGFNQLGGKRMALPGLKAKLRAYQKEGVKWINYLYENNLGGCLADDMGLGKTIQAIGMLTRVYPKTNEPTLIVMPRSLLFNWQGELGRFAPQLSVYTYYGATRDIDAATKSQVVLTTYALVRNDVEAFSKQQWHYVILDESQNIKNFTAQTTQAVLLLGARHRLALSGTPIENNLTELYSLFRFLNPTMFGSINDFNALYTYPIQKENDKEAMLSLRRKIFPFMLRRLKKDVLQELPDRTEQTLCVEMEKAHADFYEQRRQYYYRQVHDAIAAEGIQKSQFVMFQALSELRRIASVPESLSNGEIASPKLDALMDTVVEAVTNRHKVVVFFNFIAGLELCGERLESQGIDFASMTGSTRDRQSVVERFQNDPQCMVLLMTLKTGGVGLNLTAADTVLLFEPWWNKAAEEQAINRLHRYGQKAKVMSYSLITKGTIEEKIQLLQQQKAALFKNLIGSDQAMSKQLTEEDINYILGK